VRRRFSAGSIRIQVGDYTIQLVDPPRGQVAALDIPEIIRLVGEVIGVLGEKIFGTGKGRPARQRSRPSPMPTGRASRP
jgi:hypothetical protein